MGDDEEFCSELERGKKIVKKIEVLKDLILGVNNDSNIIINNTYLIGQASVISTVLLMENDEKLTANEIKNQLKEIIKNNPELKKYVDTIMGE